MTATPVSEQPALPFGPRRVGPTPYRPSTRQEEVADHLQRYARRLKDAPSGLTTIVLHGPAGAGKTRLLEETPLDAVPLPIADAGPLEIFAEINQAAAAREVMILEARNPPDCWFEDVDDVPPDVRSRLGAIPQVPLDRPSGDALLPVLLADLALHGHRLSENEARRVADVLPRHFGAPRAFCQALDGPGPKAARNHLLVWAIQAAEKGLAET